MLVKFNLAVFWLVVMTTCHARAQEELKIDKRTARQLAREYGEMQLMQRTEMNAVILDSLIHARKFMLSAAYVDDLSGNRVLVDERANFMAIDSPLVRIQYSLEYLIGGGGLDGFRTTGYISSYSMEMVGRDQDMYSVSGTATTDAGDFSFFAIISQTGEATATIDGFSSGRLTYYGTVSFLDVALDSKGLH